MSSYLAGVKTYSFQVEEFFDEVQDDDQKLQLSNQRRISVRWPNKVFGEDEGDMASGPRRRCKSLSAKWGCLSTPPRPPGRQKEHNHWHMPEVATRPFSLRRESRCQQSDTADFVVTTGSELGTNQFSPVRV